MEGHGGALALATARAYGVEEIFTLSGGHVFPLYDAAHTTGVPIIDVRHEQTAVFAAEAIARLRRRPGLAVLTAGPGVTNRISGLTSAWFNGAPVLVLASYVIAPRPLELAFSRAEILSLFMGVLIGTLVAGDGRSNWFKGVQLVAVYLIIALMFYFIPTAG